MKQETRKQLNELETAYPDGLGGDLRYLKNLFNYPDTYVRDDIEATIRLWESNIRTKPNPQAEEILEKLREVEK